MYQRLGIRVTLPRTSPSLPNPVPRALPLTSICALPGKFQCSTQPGREGRQRLRCQGCPWLTPSPSPHPQAAQQAPQTDRGWSVTQLCHSPVDCANTLSWDDKHTSRRRTGKINLRNSVCFLHTPYCYYFPFLHFLSPRLPLFLSKARLQVLLLASQLLSHWHPVLLFNDRSRHLTPVRAGSKPAHTHLLRRLSSHLFRPVPATSKHTSTLMAQASSNASQPRHHSWQQEHRSSFILITFCTHILSLAPSPYH